jgi:hypothetical protein
MENLNILVEKSISEKIKKNIKKSQNINEMLMFMEIFYKGPNPDMFNKSLHKEVFELKNNESVKDYLLSLIDKMDFNSKIKKIKNT